MIELGLGEEIELLKMLFLADLVSITARPRAQVELSLEWEYYLIEGENWLVIPRDRATGRFWTPVITDAACGSTGDRVGPNIAMSLAKPGCQGDFFDLELLASPGGLGDTRQVVYRDRLGWFVFGEASNASHEGFAWYDERKERDKSWTPFDHFSPAEAAIVEQVPVQDESGHTHLVWKVTNVQPGVEWQFDPDIQVWKLDVLGLLQKQAGIEYPPDSSSHYEAQYGKTKVEFNFRIAKSLSDQIEKPYIQIPHGLLEEMYLHAMGRYMLFARRVDPVRYKAFFSIADAIRQDMSSGGARSHADWPEFRTAAKDVLEGGPVPLNFKPDLSRESWGMQGDVRDVVNLSYYFMSAQEYQAVEHFLTSADVAFFTADPGNPYYDTQTLLIISGQDVIVFSYNRGWNNQPIITPASNPQQYIGTPLEMLPAGMSDFWYFWALHNMYRDCLWVTQGNVLNTKDVTYFDPVESRNWTEPRLLRFAPQDFRAYKLGEEPISSFFTPSD